MARKPESPSRALEGISEAFPHSKKEKCFIVLLIAFLKHPLVNKTFAFQHVSRAGRPVRFFSADEPFSENASFS